MKAVVAAFNQEKALVGAFSVITNLRMELFQALVLHHPSVSSAELHAAKRCLFSVLQRVYVNLQSDQAGQILWACWESVDPMQSEYLPVKSRKWKLNRFISRIPDETWYLKQTSLDKSFLNFDRSLTTTLEYLQLHTCSLFKLGNVSRGGWG